MYYTYYCVYKIYSILVILRLTPSLALLHELEILARLLVPNKSTLLTS